MSAIISTAANDDCVERTFIIPRPIINHRRIRIRLNKARSILTQQSQHRRAPRPTIHPNGQRSISRILPRLKEPEESVDLVRLVLYTKICKRACWKMHITGVASYALGGLAEVVLGQSLGKDRRVGF
jgi:hypothetical protein